MANKEITQNKLASLAKEIQVAHAECYTVAIDSLEHARAAGELLMKAKELCKHGDWQEWVEEKCRLPDRTARMYMQLASAWPQIEAKRRDLAVLGLFDATKLIAAPKKKKPKKKKAKSSQPIQNENLGQPTEPLLQEPIEEDQGPEGEIPAEFEEIFDTRIHFDNVVHFLARIQEIPFILRNSICRIKEDFFPRISEAIQGFDEDPFFAILEDIEETIVVHRLEDLTKQFFDDLKEWKPHSVCSCYVDGKADPGCEKCSGYGYKSKE